MIVSEQFALVDPSGKVLPETHDYEETALKAAARMHMPHGVISVKFAEMTDADEQEDAVTDSKPKTGTARRTTSTTKE